MNKEELGILADTTVQIYSLTSVAQNYADNYYTDEKMLHLGLIIDKIHEQASRLKNLLEDKQIIP